MALGIKYTPDCKDLIWKKKMKVNTSLTIFKLLICQDDILDTMY